MNKYLKHVSISKTVKKPDQTTIPIEFGSWAKKLNVNWTSFTVLKMKINYEIKKISPILYNLMLFYFYLHLRDDHKS
jgi:hypothetical protein